jgi:crotonobetainyl-CoA:carnitine CoA-transferase CaiB-like acyl-CoA transferase
LAGPLSHIRVLDLSRIVAGPWATQTLADLGADVIKIERPEVGDDTRTWGPPFLRNSQGDLTNNSGYFLSVNRGKRSVTVDLSSTQGQEIIRALAIKADIVIENFKVGTLKRFGLGPEDLRGLNPRLIYASISGFGQDGPRADQPAYDFMVQAMGGLMSVTGEAEGKPGAGPQKVGVPIVDLMTGMYVTVAVLAALEKRRESGRGDFIDIALLDVQVAFLANRAMNFLLTGDTPVRHGNAHPSIQPQDVYSCNDGFIAIACGNDGQFVRMVHALGRPELATDQRFRDNSKRLLYIKDLRGTLEHTFSRNTLEHWVSILEAAAIPCAPINSIPQCLSDKQVVHRGMVRKLSHDVNGDVSCVVSPIRFQENPLTCEVAPPTLGQHTTEILGELGLDHEEIETLRAFGVV